MNRRSFFTKLGLAAASFAILPAATTYARKWVAPTAQCAMWVVNPEWVNAPYEMEFVQGSERVIEASMCPAIKIPYRYVFENFKWRIVQPFIKA